MAGYLQHQVGEGAALHPSTQVEQSEKTLVALTSFLTSRVKYRMERFNVSRGVLMSCSQLNVIWSRVLSILKREPFSGPLYCVPVRGDSIAHGVFGHRVLWHSGLQCTCEGSYVWIRVGPLKMKVPMCVSQVVCVWVRKYWDSAFLGQRFIFFLSTYMQRV